jgi:DNA-binding NarL/FixJ family response regulator
VEALAAMLNISERTVRNHLQSCFRKLGVHSQVELGARLRRRGG